MTRYDGKNVLKLDGGWVINLLEGATTRYDISEYRLKHTHEGYNWSVNHSSYAPESERVMRCLKCRAIVPEEALGFIELLRWET